MSVVLMFSIAASCGKHLVGMHGKPGSSPVAFTPWHSLRLKMGFISSSGKARGFTVALAVCFCFIHPHRCTERLSQPSHESPWAQCRKSAATASHRDFFCAKPVLSTADVPLSIPKSKGSWSSKQYQRPIQNVHESSEYQWGYRKSDRVYQGFSTQMFSHLMNQSHRWRRHFYRTPQRSWRGTHKTTCLAMGFPIQQT